MPQSDAAAAAPPFIIWTLQRTGGTNLAQRLAERSAYGRIHHDPFTPDRNFGRVTSAWQKSPDRAALESGIAEIVARRPLIKHCVEAVPWDVTEALLAATIKAGYNHLILYRRQPLDRLLSLHFARETDIWGPKMRKQVEQSGGSDTIAGEVLARALPVDELVHHEKRCVALLSTVLRTLEDSGIAPKSLAFEDIYRAQDTSVPARELLPLLAYLGLSRGAPDDREFVAELVGRGDQGTRSKYRDIPGVPDLETKLLGIGRFEPQASHDGWTVKPLVSDSPHLLRFNVNMLPVAGSADAAFGLQGVAVLGPGAPQGASLVLVGEDVEIAADWNLPSPWIMRKHPDAANASHARFRVVANRSQASRSFTLLLNLPNAATTRLAEVRAVSD